MNAIQRSKGELVTSDHFETRTTEMRTHVDGRFAEMRAYVDSGLTAVRAHIDRQSAVFHRALWLHGVAIVGVLAGLYALVGGG